MPTIEPIVALEQIPPLGEISAPPVIEPVAVPPPAAPTRPNPPAVPEPEVIIKDNAWLFIPAALIFCAMVAYSIQRIQTQDKELQRTQAELDMVAKEREAVKASETARLQQFQIELTKQQARSKEMTEALNRTTAELRSTADKSAAREKELQDLITFLRSEIEASEAQLEVLKKALAAKPEVRKPLN